jgi:hypothetical protein
MAATSNRFEALSEEEEIEFEDDDLSLNGQTSDEFVDALMVDQGGSRSIWKQTVSFKTVKKRGKSHSKSKLKTRFPTAVATSDAKAVHSGTSPLYRSSLASTFETKSPALVTLTKPGTTPSGRGGGLHGSPPLPVGPFSSVGAPHPSALSLNLAADHDVSHTPDSTKLTMDEQFQDAITGDSEVESPQIPPPESSSSPSLSKSSESSLQQVLVDQPAQSTNASPANTTTSASSAYTTYTDYQNPLTTSAEAQDLTTPANITQKEQASELTTASPPAFLSDQASSSVSQAEMTSNQPKNTLRLHTFRAQLTLGLKLSQKVNMADQFTLWIAASIKLLGHFALLPFDGEGGSKVTSVDDIRRGDPDFFVEYYGNH